MKKIMKLFKELFKPKAEIKEIQKEEENKNFNIRPDNFHRNQAPEMGNDTEDLLLYGASITDPEKRKKFFKTASGLKKELKQ